MFNKLRPQTVDANHITGDGKSNSIFIKSSMRSPLRQIRETLATLLILTQGEARKRCVREFCEKHLERIVTYTGEADRSFAFSSIHIEIDLAHATDRAQALLRGNQPRLPRTWSGCAALYEGRKSRGNDRSYGRL